MKLQNRCFPVNIAKFLRTYILKSICERLLLPSAHSHQIIKKSSNNSWKAILAEKKDNNGV